MRLKMLGAELAGSLPVGTRPVRDWSDREMELLAQQYDKLVEDLTAPLEYARAAALDAARRDFAVGRAAVSTSTPYHFLPLGLNTQLIYQNLETSHDTYCKGCGRHHEVWERCHPLELR
jgi:hypothetical protein